MESFKAYLGTVILGGVLGLFFSMAADRFTSISFDTNTPEAEIIAVLPVYDNPHTKRLVGNLELYNSSGGVLFVR